MIVDFLIRKSYVKEGHKELYEYVVSIMLGKAITYISLLLIGLFIHKVIQMLVFVFTFTFLRESTGGYHASTWMKCYITSICVCTTICAWICEWMSKNIYLEIGLIFLDAIVIFTLAPINHPNLHLNSTEFYLCRKTAQKKCMLLIGTIFVMAVLAIPQRYISVLVAALSTDSFSICIAKICRQEVKLKNEEQRTGKTLIGKNA
jgi:accessory gene regulator B